MAEKLAVKTVLCKGFTHHFTRMDCFRSLKNGMLGSMDQHEFSRLYKVVEEKLAKGVVISQEDRIILLIGLLLAKETRQQQRYGQV